MSTRNAPAGVTIVRNEVFATAAVLILVASAARSAEIPPELRVGRAGHAFDHLGGFADQAAAAAKSGATIIYATGIGGLGYSGLPPHNEFRAALERVSDYSRQAKQNGIELMIGYLCATSLVKLDTFDKNWPEEFRSQFQSRPAEWRQQDRQGRVLKSWYGGDYEPACMNHPDWRAYQRAMVGHQLATGHDGVFFDNPTVHPQGCYCPHCMRKFARYSKSRLAALETANPDDIETIRGIAAAHATEFLRFRATIARDFLTEMRDYARTINPHALITCNNSLNAPNVLYSQSRLYAYNIFELSQAEDFVVVEDMATQPRTEASGKMYEYGPTYQQLHAFSHGKPIVAVTIAEADYHTAPNLVRLAMAEAAAHGASYLSWPTWPEEQRSRMIAAVRPQADFLRRHETLLNDASQRSEVLLFLPFRRWLETERCAASDLAAALTKSNIQYRVICEDNFELPTGGDSPSVLVVESLSVLSPTEQAAVAAFEMAGGQVVAAAGDDWLSRVRTAISAPSITIEAPPTVRAIVRDQPERTIVHLYNLNCERRSSFEDKVSPASDVRVKVDVPFADIGAVRIDSADADAFRGPLEFTTQRTDMGTYVLVTIPRLVIHSLLVVEK